MNTYFFKRYTGTRYEYLVFITYEIDKKNPEKNQYKKQDILYLFKKGNIALTDKIKKEVIKTIGPLFDDNNLQNQWFFSKKSIDIINNNTHMSIDHIRNIIKYISPITNDISMYCDFNTENEKNFKIFTLEDAKIVNKSTDKIITKHHLSKYFICKLPPGKRLTFNASTEYNKPYIDDNEYDIDAQQEIKEIILFDIVDNTLLELNNDQKFLYFDQSINKQEIDNNYKHTINNSAKFRRNHIIPILPNYKTEKILYDILKIDENKLIETFTRYESENNLSFIKEDLKKNIAIGFSIVGSSEYCPIYLFNSFSSLRSNISQYKFYDKDFMIDLITNIINSINNYIYERTNKKL